MPIVAITGRPNVGKSTLFNRLTGSRAALVSDLPGLTRDRREGSTKIGTVDVTIVDTAGFEKAQAGSIAERMRRQTETAVAGADVVLFVVDSRSGITADDKDFARIVRSSGKPVVLVANKSEGRAGRDGFFESYDLGLGEPLPISAEHGEGLGDLVAEMAAALGIEIRPPVRKRRGEQDDAAEAEPAADDVPPEGRPIRVAIAGRPNAGKSTLVNALIGEDRMLTGPEPGLTRDAISTEFVYKDRKFLLFDTAGLRRKARVTEVAEKLATSDTIRAIRFAEVVILVLDGERPLEHQDLTIGDLITEEGRAIVIAVNKWDAIPDKQKRLQEFRDDVADRLSQVPGVRVVAISALAEKGIDRLMDEVIATHEIWNRRVPTSQLNRWLADALSRHSPPAVSGRHIKIKFITQPSTRPPTFVAFCQRAEQLPKTYVRYLVNDLRQAFKLPGVPIRFNLRKGDNPFEKR